MAITNLLRSATSILIGGLFSVLLISFVSSSDSGTGFPLAAAAALFFWFFLPTRRRILKIFKTPQNASWHKFVTLGLSFILFLSISAEGHRNNLIAAQKKEAAEQQVAAAAEKAAQEQQARLERLRAEKPQIISAMQNAFARDDMEEVARLARKLSPLNDPLVEQLRQQSDDYLEKKRAEQAKKEAIENEKARLFAEKKFAEEQAIEEARKKDEKRKQQQELAYSEYPDELHGKAVKLFRFSSKNSVEFLPPYDGGTEATLYFRNHPRFGKEIIVEISNGQLLCTSYEPCYPSIRIDDGKPFQARAFGPADGGHTSAYISWTHARKFVGKSDVVIALPSFQNGEPIFQFDTSVLDLKKIGFN